LGTATQDVNTALRLGHEKLGRLGVIRVISSCAGAS